MTAAAIIGMGAICSAAAGVERGFEAIRQGTDGLSRFDAFETGLKLAPLCSPVKQVPGLSQAPNRTAAMALCAAQEALAPVHNRRNLKLHIIVATTVAGMSRSEVFYRKFREDPTTAALAAQELGHHEPTALSGFLCENLGGASFCTLSTACSTGLHAVGMAKRSLTQGADLCLAVGADALSLLTIRGFSSLMLIDPSGCKPFDKRRAGISLGEGAAAMLLASEKAVRLLGVAPLAFVTGWGATADCHHMTAPHPAGDGAMRCMRAALNEAGLTPAKIGLIVSHGTATPYNDLAEITALSSVFAVVPPFCSLKRTLGHTLAASGILEAVFAVCAMQHGCILPTAGFEQPDEAIGRSPARYREQPLEHVLKNAFGFGGNNAAAVISREATG